MIVIPIRWAAGFLRFLVCHLYHGHPQAMRRFEQGRVFLFCPDCWRQLRGGWTLDPPRLKPSLPGKPDMLRGGRADAVAPVPTKASDITTPKQKGRRQWKANTTAAATAAAARRRWPTRPQ